MQSPDGPLRFLMDKSDTFTPVLFNSWRSNDDKLESPPLQFWFKASTDLLQRISQGPVGPKRVQRVLDILQFEVAYCDGSHVTQFEVEEQPEDCGAVQGRLVSIAPPNLRDVEVDLENQQLRLSFERKFPLSSSHAGRPFIFAIFLEEELIEYSKSFYVRSKRPERRVRQDREKKKATPATSRRRSRRANRIEQGLAPTREARCAQLKKRLQTRAPASTVAASAPAPARASKAKEAAAAAQLKPHRKRQCVRELPEPVAMDSANVSRYGSFDGDDASLQSFSGLDTENSLRDGAGNREAADKGSVSSMRSGDMPSHPWGPSGGTKPLLSLMDGRSGGSTFAQLDESLMQPFGPHKAALNEHSNTAIVSHFSNGSGGGGSSSSGAGPCGGHSIALPIQPDMLGFSPFFGAQHRSGTGMVQPDLPDTHALSPLRAPRAGMPGTSVSGVSDGNPFNLMIDEANTAAHAKLFPEITRSISDQSQPGGAGRTGLNEWPALTRGHSPLPVSPHDRLFVPVENPASHPDEFAADFSDWQDGDISLCATDLLGDLEDMFRHQG